MRHTQFGFFPVCVPLLCLPSVRQLIQCTSCIIQTRALVLLVYFEISLFSLAESLSHQFWFCYQCCDSACEQLIQVPDLDVILLKVLQRSGSGVKRERTAQRSVEKQSFYRSTFVLSLEKKAETNGRTLGIFINEH